MTMELQEKYKLPNGQSIYQLHNYETDFVFNEIFVEEVYLRYGIEIHDHATVFDIGANIGLFTLYIKEKFPTSKIYAFEPSPVVYNILNSNIKSFRYSGVQTYNYALSDQEEECLFYYYPNFSVISGFYANKYRDTEIIMSGITTGNEQTDLKMRSLIEDRLEQTHILNCQATTLSRMIHKEQITQIDLLKIDVEGAELSILKGIEKKDWPKIKQIAMEVHNEKDLDNIMLLLRSHSFQIHVEKDKKLKNADIYNLFAIRKKE